MYDLIGDIHGHAEQLIQLLQQLGYRIRHRTYQHPDRKVIFLGDFIDRGPQIRQTLEIVRSMVDLDHALAVIGNHELNALAYHTIDVDAPGEYLRPRNAWNEHQHIKTLEQLPNEELQSSLNWFRTLPMWLELDGIRVVHACWDDRSMAEVGRSGLGNDGIANDFLQRSCRPGNPLFEAVEILLKGKEAPLPDGVSFRDKDGHVRRMMRIRWYLSPESMTYRKYSFTDEIPCDAPITDALIHGAAPYPVTAEPVFLGHYGISAKRPALLADNVACMDYNVARGGFLCAYRWSGERTLCNDNFVWTT